MQRVDNGKGLDNCELVSGELDELSVVAISH